MSEEQFRGYLSRLEFKDGEILLGGNRYMLMPVAWIRDVMMETENIMGVGGTFALFDTASRSTTPAEETLVAFKDLPFEHKIGAFLSISALTGFGKLEVIEINKDPFKIRIKNPSPVFGDAYEGKADSPRCYFNASILPYIEAIAKMDGINEPLKISEEQCKAMGASHCVMVIEIDRGFE